MDILVQLMLDLGDELQRLQQTLPLFSYNPLCYAQDVTMDYLQRYARPNTKALLLGMNPGPYGMTQTGVPFGAVQAVQEYLQLYGTIRQPMQSHPLRPIEGFACRRQEVSGTRVWQLAQQVCPDPSLFLRHLFVWNYCPLLFLDEQGRNKTPDSLPRQHMAALFQACDIALVHMIRHLQVQCIYGVGNFAAKQAQHLCETYQLDVVCIPIAHPSPANPAANKGWSQLVWPTLAPVFGLQAHQQLPALHRSHMSSAL